MLRLHESFLAYRGFRHLKLSMAVLAAAVLLYVTQDPPGGRSGDTWVGYTLGTVAALLVVWLMLFGVRKRRYASSGAPLRGWLSAHVYLGTVLLLLVPLHTGFNFGANLHTVAYVLVCTVVASGAVGVAIYTTVPQRMTENRPGQKLQGLLEQIAAVDGDCKRLAVDLPNPVAAVLDRSIEETIIGGGIVRQVWGGGSLSRIDQALRVLERHQAEKPARDGVKQVVERLELKRMLLTRVRRDVKLKALLDAWLVLHVPLAFCAVFAVVAHTVMVFYYR